MICGGLYLVREPILFAMGQVMVVSELPVKSDAVVVLGGDYHGERILKAAQLVKDGYAPYLVVSGAGGQYGMHEADMAMLFASRHGYSGISFVPVYHAALSTLDEAKYDVAELRQRGVRKYLLVTSPSHTDRARRVFKRAAPEIEVHVVASPDKWWNDGRWWTYREGRKIWFFAAAKTIADYLGI